MQKVIENEPLICTQKEQYTSLEELPNPYHALADYQFDVYKDQWVPNGKARVNPGSSNLVPPADASEQSIVASSLDPPSASAEEIQVPLPEENTAEDLTNYHEDDDSEADLNVFHRRHPVKWSG